MTIGSASLIRSPGTAPVPSPGVPGEGEESCPSPGVPGEGAKGARPLRPRTGGRVRLNTRRLRGLDQLSHVISEQLLITRHLRHAVDVVGESDHLRARLVRDVLCELVVAVRLNDHDL